MQRVAAGHGKSPRARKGNGHAVPYKLVHAGCINGCAAVQGPLGGGEFIQVAEAEHRNRVLHGDHPERRGNTGLCVHDINAPVEGIQGSFGQQSKGVETQVARLFLFRYGPQA